MLLIKHSLLKHLESDIIHGAYVETDEESYYFVRGTKIMRGPTWEWGRQDYDRDGQRLLGTVNYIGSNGWVGVIWDKVTRSNAYRVGYFPMDSRNLCLDIVPIPSIYNSFLYMKLMRDTVEIVNFKI